MKTVNQISALVFALTLPVLASAAGYDSAKASFLRDLRPAPVTGTTMLAVREADPLVEAISAALYGETDAVVASFERDLNRTPATGVTVQAAHESDPLVEAISVALYGKTAIILA